MTVGQFDFLADHELTLPRYGHDDNGSIPD